MQIKKKTVYTAEFNNTELNFTIDGLNLLRDRFKPETEAKQIIDSMLKDLKLIQASGVTEVTHNA